jgi:hypothetical protein
MSKLFIAEMAGVQLLRAVHRFNFSDAPATWFEPGTYVLGPVGHAAEAVAAGAAVAVATGRAVIGEAQSTKPQRVAIPRAVDPPPGRRLPLVTRQAGCG